MPDEQGRVALWQHDTEITQSMAAKPDWHIVAKPSKVNLAESYWQQRSTLLLPHRMRLNTVRTLCVKLQTLVLGSLWTPCKITVPDYDQEDLEKSLSVYLNSSVGVLAMLGNRSNQVPSYPRLSIDDLRKLIVPDFATIGGDAIDKLAATYDKYANSVLLPLPRMNNCAVRRTLDVVVCDALGMDGETMDTIRLQLAAEPSVTGKRYS